MKIRDFIRRITIFPLFIVGAPILFFIYWCFGGVSFATEGVIRLIDETWRGDFK